MKSHFSYVALVISITLLFSTFSVHQSKTKVKSNLQKNKLKSKYIPDKDEYSNLLFSFF